MNELNEAIDLGINHVMLDNFNPERSKAAIDLKPDKMTYEVSGGINLDNLEKYLLKGIDAISVGSLTQSSQKVDLSLKMRRTNEF